MNRKGFAITSVIYGLSILGIMIVMILMETLSSTRSNVSEQAKEVEEMLLAFNQTEITFRNGGNYTVPHGETGWYRIEAFGASCTTDGSGNGNGAYTTGIIFLQEGEKLSIFIGGCGSATSIKKDSDLIMRAMAGANATVPGGTLACQNKQSDGGFIDVNSFKTVPLNSSLIGNDTVNYSTCGSGKYSYIRGYPASHATNSEWISSWFRNFFVDDLMVAGANAGSGKVIINRLAEKDDLTPSIPRKNPNFDGVTRITVEGLSSYYYLGVYYTAQTTDGDTYKTRVYSCSTGCNAHGRNIDDLSIVFQPQSYKTNIGNVKVIFTNATGDHVVYDSSKTGGTTAGPTGIRLSAYQPDSVLSDLNNWRDNFAKRGNYYIIPVVSENKMISAAASAADDADKLKIEYFTGNSRQKWAIDLINTPDALDTGNLLFENVKNGSARKEYRITELTRFKAMNIYYDENYRLNFISAPETFNSLSRNAPQIWNIYPMSDGTYAIKTVVPSFDAANKTGFLFAKTRGLSINNIDDIMIGGVANPDSISIEEDEAIPTAVERFYLYSLDFSK